MIRQILEELDRLHSELVAVDPTRKTEAIDRVVDLAIKLRDLLAAEGDAQNAVVARGAMSR